MNKYRYFKSILILILLIGEVLCSLPVWAQSNLDNIDVEVNDTQPNIDPNVDLEVNENNVDLNANPEFKLNPATRIGGEDGVVLEPNVELRDGNLSVDPKFDSSQAIDSLKDKAKNALVNFVLDNLGAGDFITSINQDLSVIVGDLKTFLSFGDGQEVETGDLGIPNVQQARVLFNEDPNLSKFDDILGTQTETTYNSRYKLYQQYLRDLTQGYSENSALSLAGQSKINLKIDAANAAAEQSINIAKDSTNQDVSQNLLRNLSNQNAIEQQTAAITISEMQDAKIDRSLGLQLESENLREISESNTREERASTAASSAAENSFFLITIPGNK
ncbi:MAG: hypothetical protein KME09_00200 [Pleurocapsa minor HA4230-MV1]|jgi:hypothetical protein|nr:hypothetical protein [Pleurocapsa minor HA4230-MV1]